MKKSNQQFRQPWEQRYSELLVYKAEHGHCNVPDKFKKNRALGAWVGKQRANKSSLTAERRELLNSIAFCWAPIDSAWMTRYQQLLVYKTEHGDCNVPDKWKENKALGIWVGTQRTKKSSLSGERLTLLNSIGFCWAPIDSTWMTRYQQLLVYRAEHGDCDVPRKFNEIEGLANWVFIQRRFRREKTLPKARISLLNQIQFDWDPVNTRWNLMNKTLIEYKEEFGDCTVPRSFNETEGLANWVNTQRQKKREKKISRWRVAQLNRIGFCWQPKLETATHPAIPRWLSQAVKKLLATQSEMTGASRKNIKEFDERLVQTLFQKAIAHAAGGKCALTGLKNLCDAAHVHQIGKKQADWRRNNTVGIFLAPTIHRAYDRGAIKIDRNSGLVSVVNGYRDQPELKRFHGMKVRIIDLADASTWPINN